MKENYTRVWRIINIMFFVCFLFGTIYVTLTNRVIETKELCLIPFWSFVRAQEQPEIYRSMFMNIFLFFPLGLTLPFVFPEKRKCRALLAFMFALIFSLVIEFLQYYYHLGRAETDDVICNTLGAAIGTLSYTLERKFFNK